MDASISRQELEHLDAYWRAANYLAVGQIYLLDNALLREPLRPVHIKPRLLGHWGTTPGLNFVYAHMNRAIRKWDLNALLLVGPGHGGPAAVANAYLEGAYGEAHTDVGDGAEGIRNLFRQFSFPGGIGSHCTAEVPGSIHEGGELGYSLAHAYGAAFDDPTLLVCCVVGDGEAETGALATSWHSNKFLDPARDGAVLPILHLNGYKIANPTVLARVPEEELLELLRGYGYHPYVVAGDDPPVVHRQMAAALDAIVPEIREIQRAARAAGGAARRPRWPMIVLQTPKGWTGPKEVDGTPIEGTFRAHQVPITDPRTNPAHLAILESWMRSYRPDELFDGDGRLRAELAALAPRGERRMSGEPDVVMACCGDVPTLETLAAVGLIREHLPDLRVRVVNVVDLMRLQPPSEHPHGLADAEFDALFTTRRPVIFAFHGYPWLVHRLAYRRANHEHIHVRGYKEEGTVTTPFDMVMLNDLDRFHLVMDVIDRVPGLASRAGGVRQLMADRRVQCRAYTRREGEDAPEIRDWTWRS